MFDELDEVFANIYSTVVSTQNVHPRLDRRVLAVIVGTIAVVLGLSLDIHSYESFLLLLGSVFLPLFGAFMADYFLVRRGDWDVSDTARPRWEMVLPWLAGFVTYQLINPGHVSWWARFWTARQQDLPFAIPTWASASILSFAVAAVLAVAIGRFRAPSPRL